MGNGDYAALLPQLTALKSWISQVEDAAFEAIAAAGYDRDLLYVRTPLTLSAAEKLVGKTKFTELAGAYIQKPPGAPTIVPVSDKRPPFTIKPTPEEAFKN